MAPGDYVSFEVGPDAVSKLYTILQGQLLFAMVFVTMRVKYQFGSLKPIRAIVYGFFYF